jgi:hypothetical protein
MCLERGLLNEDSGAGGKQIRGGEAERQQLKKVTVGCGISSRCSSYPTEEGLLHLSKGADDSIDNVSTHMAYD